MGLGPTGTQAFEYPEDRIDKNSSTEDITELHFVFLGSTSIKCVPQLLLQFVSLLL